MRDEWLNKLDLFLLYFQLYLSKLPCDDLYTDKPFKRYTDVFREMQLNCSSV